MRTEIHLSIVWSTARSMEEEILAEYQEKFKILEVYEVYWNKGDFVENLKRFYSHSQSHLTQRDLKKLMIGKAKYCGFQPFLLIIFEDLKPLYQDRITSNGKRNVNVNVFDIKQKLRKNTGGGHKIHGTDTILETNKDLTLLLGLNYGDFIDLHSEEWNGNIDIIKNNVFGFNGFKSISQLFYLLNATLEYVVLRNFEEFPNEITLNEHSDVDLLVENKNVLIYTVGAKAIFHQKHRVHYSIIIDGKNVPFDLRHIGDSYFDKAWQKEVLKSRVLEKNIFYRPNPQEYFYTLLYHALVHKKSFGKDYQKRLNIMKQQMKNKSPTMVLLREFMNENNYRFCEPKDFSVFYNIDLSKMGVRRRLHHIYIPKLRRTIKSLIS